ncbi:MAG: UDP-3-O-(3-hydroxymyristoyl)glucosamine N-acyltransferase [Oligoflexales bacterium]
MRLADIAKSIGATLRVPSEKIAAIDIVKISEIDKAREGDLSFVANEGYKKYLGMTKASAVIVKDYNPEFSFAQLVHSNPYAAFARASQLLQPKKALFSGVSDRAFVSASARLGANVVVYPFAHIGNNVSLGDNAVIFPGTYVGDGVTIGAGTVVHANCSVMDHCIIGSRCIIHAGTVIGADGFGFAPDGSDIVKVPQLGIVRIGDDVELGALCSIDRATLGETIIGNKTKFDDRVHIAHNVEVGERCLFAAYAGIAGSTKVGNDVMMGGHAGVAGHLSVCDRVVLGAMTGVIKDIDEPGMYVGYPAIPAAQWRKRQALMNRLESHNDKIKLLETKVAELEKALSEKK